MSNALINRLLATDNRTGALALFAASRSLLFSGGGRSSADAALAARADGGR
jgi:hypothetical protein